MWERHGYGFDLHEAFDDVEEGFINHVVWSDNVWLIGKDERQVLMMVRSLTDLMNHFGLRWKKGSTKIIASGGYDVSLMEPLAVMNDGIEMLILWKTCTTILGTCVGDTADTKMMVEAQIRKATGVFYKESAVFFGPGISFKQKVGHYLKHVLPVVLHGCGTWIAKQSTLVMIHGFETRMLKLMFGYKKRKTMDWVTWHRTATNMAKENFFKLGNVSITVKYFKRLLKFAATTFSQNNHCAALKAVKSVVGWKDTQYWRTCQAAEGTTDDKGWKHCCRGVQRKRWDEVFLMCLGENWKEFLAHLDMKPAEWKELCSTFVSEAHIYCDFAIDKGNDAKAIEATVQPFVQPPAKKPRTEPPPCFFEKTYLDDRTFHIQICGDSSTVISWMNLMSDCTGVMSKTVCHMRRVMMHMWQN